MEERDDDDTRFQTRSMERGCSKGREKSGIAKGRRENRRERVEAIVRFRFRLKIAAGRGLAVVSAAAVEMPSTI